MKAKKLFYVIAYDITNNKRRNQISKVLEKIGFRINHSVFECMLTEKQLTELTEYISNTINKKEDTVIFYPLCVNCFSKIHYLPTRRIIGKMVLLKE